MARYFKTESEIQVVLNEKINHPVYEPKKNDVNHSPEEIQYLNEKYNELEKILDHERVMKYNRTSIGEFQTKQTRILVTQKVGKWDNFGFMENKLCYLQPHEALFLVEMKRLMVFREGVCMSLEDCYSLFLSSEVGLEVLTLDEYLTYSTIIKNGFSVQLHKSKTVEVIRTMSEYDSLVWTRLNELLGNAPPENLTNKTLYKMVTQTMEKQKDEIINSHLKPVGNRTEEENIETINTKRKGSNDEGPSKKMKISSKESLLNDLISDPEFRKFETMFNKLDVINLKSTEVKNFSSCYRFQFDIYSPKTNKNEKKQLVPNYRAIVIKNGQTPPSRDDLVFLQNKQNDDCPILVIAVDESLCLNAFLYKII